MEKVVRKFASFEEAERADREYYANLTSEQRLEIFAEILRRGRGEGDASFGDASYKRLARVYRIAQLSRS